MEVTFSSTIELSRDLTLLSLGVAREEAEFGFCAWEMGIFSVDTDLEFSTSFWNDDCLVWDCNRLTMDAFLLSQGIDCVSNSFSVFSSIMIVTAVLDECEKSVVSSTAGSIIILFNVLVDALTRLTEGLVA